MSAEELRAKIREIPDFPKPGILFYDITTLLKDPKAYKEAIDLMLAPYAGERIDLVVGMESRGFIFGAPMAYQLDAGLVLVRKLGKLPAETITVGGTGTAATIRISLSTGSFTVGVSVAGTNPTGTAAISGTPSTLTQANTTLWTSEAFTIPNTAALAGETWFLTVSDPGGTQTTGHGTAGSDLDAAGIANGIANLINAAAAGDRSSEPHRTTAPTVPEGSAFAAAP